MRFLAFLLSLLLLAGCGPDPRPTINVETPSGIQSDAVTINFRVRHRSADPVDVQVIFSSDGGRTFHPGTVVDEESVKNLRSSKKGVSHTLEWDSLTDGVGTPCAVKNARIRLRPVTTADYGRSDTTGDFAVNNAGSSAPEVTIVPLQGVLSGAIDVDYTVADEDSDPVTVQVVYSTDEGETYAPATPTPWSEGTVGLLTSAFGQPYTFTWDSVEDLGYGFTSRVRLQVWASDGIAFGACEVPGETADFRVDNGSVVPKLYVADPVSGALGEIDTNTGASTSFTFPGVTPSGIAAVRTSLGTLLMVTDASSGVVAVIDPFSWSLYTTIQAGAAPRGIVATRVVDASGVAVNRAYVANSGDDRVSIIDTDSFSVAGTLNVGSEPTGVAAVDVFGGMKVYVTLKGDDAVEVIDAVAGGLAPQSPIAVSGTDPGPITAVHGAAGPFVYVGNRTSSSVSVIDAAADALLEYALQRVDFPDPAGLASFDVPGGRTLVLVTCGGDDSLQIVDVDAGHTLLDTVPRVAGDPGGVIALRTHMGSRAYFTDGQAGEVGQIDLDLLDDTGFAFPLPPITGLPTGISIITYSAE